VAVIAEQEIAAIRRTAAAAQALSHSRFAAVSKRSMAALAAARDSSRWTSTQVDDRPSRTDGVTTGSKAKAIPGMWASNAAPDRNGEVGRAFYPQRRKGRLRPNPCNGLPCRVQALHRRGRENSPSRPYDSGDDGCRSADDQRTIMPSSECRSCLFWVTKDIPTNNCYDYGGCCRGVIL
jgi:hypothetical protein